MENKITAEKMSEIVQNVIRAQKMLEEILSETEEHGVAFVSTPFDELSKSIHVYRGIYKLAEIFGCYPPVVSPRDNEEYPYCTSFTHNGVRYYQISKTEVAE